MRQVWIGHDPRQPLSWNVMRYSVEKYASPDIVVRGLFLDKLPIERQGATEFTFSRFLVPYLCGFEGLAIFADEDQVVTDDIGKLFDYCQADMVNLGEKSVPSVWVMKRQPQFEWPSVMVFNCAECKTLTPEYIDNDDNVLFDFDWANEVGEFPSEWNHYVSEHPPRDDAKLYHYSRGIPFWEECQGFPEDEYWWSAYRDMVKSVDWIDLHSNTRHFKPTLQRHFERKYRIKLR